MYGNEWAGLLCLEVNQCHCGDECGDECGEVKYDTPTEVYSLWFNGACLELSLEAALGKTIFSYIYTLL